MADAATAEKAPLDDVMMAMDVVDTLRHAEKLVERELSGEQRREQMIERLRGVYQSQGITVSDQILAEGVDALEQERFVYKPKRGGFAFTLARLYVRRAAVGRNIAIGAATVLIAFVVWFFLIEQPRQNRLADQQAMVAALQVELDETIPAELERLLAAITEEADDPDLIRRAEIIAEDGAVAAAAGEAEDARGAVADLETMLADLRAMEGLQVDLDRLATTIAEEANYEDIALDAAIIAQDGTAAAIAGDLAAARQAESELEDMLAELRLAFDLRVVSRPGEQSGVFRIPDANQAARNYYLLVEAIGPDGQAIPREITSEEDGTTRTVTMWGVRVPQSVYNAAVADKQDDGIIQNDLVAEKIRGDLDITWVMDTLGGAITDW